MEVAVKTLNMCDNSHCNKAINKLLIDFNSPLQTRLEVVNSGHLIPLVPSPLGSADSLSNTSISNQTTLHVDNDSDEENNPFDLVVHQTKLNIRMLNDPFELVYQKAYHLATDTYEGIGTSTDSNYSSHLTDTSVNEVSTNPVSNSTVTSLQNVGNTGDKNCNFHSNSLHQLVEHMNEGIGEFSTEDSLICIEDITDPTGHMFLNLSDNSDVLKQSSETERKNESNELNIVNTTNAHQTSKNGNEIYHTKHVENEQSVDVNNLLANAKSSCCNGCTEEQNCFSVGCVYSKAGTDVPSPSREVLMNSNSHSDEELKAIVANRINVCIQNALGKSKLSVQENCVSDYNSASHAIVTTPDKKTVLPQVCSTYKYSFSFTSPIKKTGLAAALSGDVNTPTEVICQQQGLVNSVNTGLASGPKTPLDRLKMREQRSSSNSTASIGSYGELNKAFYETVSARDALLGEMCRVSSSDVGGSGPGFNGSFQLPSVSCSIAKSASLDFTNGSSEEKNDKHGNILGVDKNTSTCSPSNMDDHVAENMFVRTSLSSSCVGSSRSNNNEELNGDDSVFMEANTLAFVFSNVADSFTHLTSSEEEEDILTCKPLWEVSQLNLPKFNSEEDGAEEVESNDLEPAAGTKKDGGKFAGPIISNEKTESPLHDTSSDHEYRYKNSSSQKKSVVNKKSGCRSTSSESSVSSRSSKRSSGSGGSSSSTPPLSKQRIQGLSLHTRLSSPVDKKLSRAVPNVILPSALNLMSDKEEKDMRLKPKRKQQVGKRGPMKAVVPVDNMTRGIGIEKKGVQPEAPVHKANSVVITNTPKSVRSHLNHESETNNTPVMRAKSCQKKIVTPVGVPLLQSRTDIVKKDSSGINKSFTAPSSTSCVPTLRRANSLTSGIPSLTSPAVTLQKRLSSSDNSDLSMSYKENLKSMLIVQPTTPVRKQPSCQIPALDSQRKSRSSSNIPQFNVSGLVVTSTPTRRDRYTSSTCSTPKCLPSPIPIRGVIKKPSLETETSEIVKTVNRSFDVFQGKDKTKTSPKHHGRSKSVSSIQPKEEKQPSSLTVNPNNESKTQISSDKSLTLGNGVKKGHLKSLNFQIGTPKPLAMKNLNNQYVASKEVPKMDSPSSGTNQKRAKQIIQLFSKLKRGAVMPMDKENVEPLCEIHL